MTIIGHFMFSEMCMPYDISEFKKNKQTYKKFCKK